LNLLKIKNKIKDFESRIGLREPWVELWVRDTGRADVAWKCDTVRVRRVETSVACGSDGRKVERCVAAHPSLDRVDFSGVGTSGIRSIE
jgi:hypothetical protein